MVTEYLSKWVVGETASRYSIIPGNNVAPSYSNYGGNFLEDIPELINNNVIPKLNSQTNDVTKAGLDGVFHPASSIDYMFGLDGNNNDVRYQLNEEMSEDGEVEQASEVRHNTTKTPETINIYAGTGENSDLSNFAIRPIDSSKIDEEDWTNFPRMDRGLAEETFQTVEGAFQAAKLGYTESYNNNYKFWNEEGINLHNQLMEASGPEARKLGRSIKGLDTKAWDADSSSIMKILIKESFRQNPDALQRLLSTGNAMLTHTQDKGKWGIEFPRILMEVRNELSQDSNEFNNIEEFPTDEMNHCIKS